MVGLSVAGQVPDRQNQSVGLNNTLTLETLRDARIGEISYSSKYRLWNIYAYPKEESLAKVLQALRKDLADYRVVKSSHHYAHYTFYRREGYSLCGATVGLVDYKPNVKPSQMKPSSTSKGVVLIIIHIEKE